jgi:hypothetical protein
MSRKSFSFKAHAVRQFKTGRGGIRLFPIFSSTVRRRRHFLAATAATRGNGRAVHRCRPFTQVKCAAGRLALLWLFRVLRRGMRVRYPPDRCCASGAECGAFRAARRTRFDSMARPREACGGLGFQGRRAAASSVAAEARRSHGACAQMLFLCPSATFAVLVPSMVPFHPAEQRVCENAITKT